MLLDSSHQEAYCLSTLCCECPVFLDPRAISQIPGVGMPPSRNARRRGIRLLLVVLVMVLIIVLLASLGILASFFPTPVAPSMGDTVQPTSTPSVAGTGTRVVQSLSPTATITRLPTKIPTPTLLPLVLLETPIGNDPRWVIHMLEAGDNLTRLAEQYQTSIEAIKWVNYKLPVPLQESRVIIIPLRDVDTTADLPAFEAYQVVEEGLGVEALAASLGVDAGPLASFNNLSLDQVLSSGTWLIIPRQRNK